MKQPDFKMHRGVKYLDCDYSRLSPEEMIEYLQRAVTLGKTAGNRLFILADFNKTPKSKRFNELIKAHGKEFKLNGVAVKIAVLGINSTLKRVIVNSSMLITRINNVKLFETKEEALAWLTIRELSIAS